MAVAVKSIGSVELQNNVNTIEVTPGTMADGDLVVVFCGAVSQAELTINETGFSQSAHVSSGGTNRGCRLFWKIASSEPASFTMNLASTPASMRGVAMVFTGMDATTPSDATPTTDTGGQNSDTGDSPSITTVTDGAMILSCIYAVQVSGSDRTAPSGYTEDVDGGAASMVYISHLIKGTAGGETPGTISGMGANADHLGITFAIRPQVASAVTSVGGVNRGVVRGVMRGVG